MGVLDTDLWKNNGLPFLFDGKNPIKNARFAPVRYFIAGRSG